MLAEPNIFYDFAQLSAYLKKAETNDITIVLQNPPSSIFYMGLPLIEQMIKQASAIYAKAKFDFILDCEDDPAIALLALQQGFKQIKFSGNAVMVEKINKIAKNYSANILT